MKTLKHCLNPILLVGLAIVAVALYFVALSAALGGLPLIILIVCPLSMVLMMWGMGKMGTNPASAPEVAPSLRGVETESPNR